jgi:hypothetical protein
MSINFEDDLAISNSEEVRQHFRNAYKTLFPKLTRIEWLECISNDKGIDAIIHQGNRHTICQEKALYGDLTYKSYFFETRSHYGPGWLFNDDIFNSNYLFLARITPNYKKSRINIYRIDEIFIDYLRIYSHDKKQIVNKWNTGAGCMIPYNDIKKWEIREVYYDTK